MELSASSNIKKSLSYQEISKKLEASFQQHRNMNQKVFSTSNLINDPLAPIRPTISSPKVPEHRTVIYFGDSFRKNEEVKPKLVKVEAPKVEDSYHARRLCEELQFTRQSSVRKSKNFSVLCQKAENFTQQQALRPTKPAPPPPPHAAQQSEQRPENDLKPNLNTTEIRIDGNADSSSELVFKRAKCDKVVEVVDNEDATLPPFIESVINGVINIRIEDNYEVASRIVRSVHERGTSGDIELFSEEDGDEEAFDWSFVQEWRTR